MDQNVRYYWIQELANHLCLNHIIYTVSHFIWYQNVHLKHKRIQVGNGHFTSVVFIILIIVDIHGHILEIYTLVSEIHENVDLALGIKNIFELDSVINS